MSYKLFLDDERFPVDDTFVIARSYDDAVQLFHLSGFPAYVSFDHDLGSKMTGFDFATFLINQDLDNDNMPDGFTWYVHSQNPVGSQNIDMLLRNYINRR